MAKKKRLDILLVERGLLATRAKARAAIMSGQVNVDGALVDKAGTPVSPDADVEVKEVCPFVSRGGQKLAKALQAFAIDVSNRRVLDVGASTGGFTDCSLQAGAALVYAVDVGYGQLAWSLRTDSRVVNLERTNIRHLTAAQLTRGSPDFCCIDVAFISLRMVLPVVAQLLIPPGELVMLIKPQFEAGRQQVGSKGVVRDAQVHVEVVEKVLARAQQLDFGLKNLDYSPIRGPQGNIEYLAHGFFGCDCTCSVSPQEVVTAAHRNFSVE